MSSQRRQSVEYTCEVRVLKTDEDVKFAQSFHVQPMLPLFNELVCKHAVDIVFSGLWNSGTLSHDHCCSICIVLFLWHLLYHCQTPNVFINFLTMKAANTTYANTVKANRVLPVLPTDESLFRQILQEFAHYIYGINACT